MENIQLLVLVQAMGRGRLLPADALTAMKIKDFSGLKDMNWIIFLKRSQKTPMDYPDAQEIDMGCCFENHPHGWAVFSESYGG